MHDGDMKAEEINKLLSIPDLKSTIEGQTIIYSTGEFSRFIRCKTIQTTTC